MHLPANTWSARHESRGDTAASSTGSTITAAGSANTKGSWAALGAATSFAYEGITVYLANNSAAADYMLDIGIDDGAGNNSVIVADLHFPAAKNAGEHNLQIFIPVHIPSGSLVEARVACSTASATLACLVVGHSANIGGHPGYSRAIALFTPASSRGVAVDPGGTANTEGAWAQLTASSSADVHALFGVVGFNGDVGRSANASMLLDVGVGASTEEYAVIPNLSFGWETTTDGPTSVHWGPVAAAIPSGSRVVARAQCAINTAGDRTADLALYGLVP